MVWRDILWYLCLDVFLLRHELLTNESTQVYSFLFQDVTVCSITWRQRMISIFWRIGPPSGGIYRGRLSPCKLCTQISVCVWVHACMLASIVCVLAHAWSGYYPSDLFNMGDLQRVKTAVGRHGSERSLQAHGYTDRAKVMDHWSVCLRKSKA